MFRYLLLSLLFTLFLSACGTESASDPEPLATCSNGMADTFTCSNIDLQAIVSPAELIGEKLNDTWGWTDSQTQKEYALVGLTDGVTFVDITEPSLPVVIGKLTEPAAASSKIAEPPQILRHDDSGGLKGESAWRDLKVYKNHLFITSEQNNHGLQIFDLTQLRDQGNPPVMFTDYQLYSKFGNAHNIAINEETGFAYITGSTSGELCAENGALHIVDITSPKSPEYAGCHLEESAGGFTRNGYVHDTQCVIYNGPDQKYLGREICFSSSELSFLISDVTDKSNPITLSNSTFAGRNYLHQGWLTNDHSRFFMNDELDEIRLDQPTKTYIWSLDDLKNPEMIGFYTHSAKSIDHNLYIRNETMYQANYTAGLRIFDVSNPQPDQINEIGFFDTTPDNDDAEFAGLWSVYPWYRSHKIVVSDIDHGLFILTFNP